MAQESLTCYSLYNYMHCLYMQLNPERVYTVIAIAVAPICSLVPSHLLLRTGGTHTVHFWRGRGLEPMQQPPLTLLVLAQFLCSSTTIQIAVAGLPCWVHNNCMCSFGISPSVVLVKHFAFQFSNGQFLTFSLVVVSTREVVLVLVSQHFKEIEFQFSNSMWKSTEINFQLIVQLGKK